MITEDGETRNKWGEKFKFGSEKKWGKQETTRQLIYVVQKILPGESLKIIKELIGRQSNEWFLLFNMTRRCSHKILLIGARKSLRYKVLKLALEKKIAVCAGEIL